MSRVLVAMALVLGTATAAAAQTTRDDLVSALTRLQRAVDALDRRRPAELVEAIHWLRGSVARTNPSEVSTA